jgi:periplasmic protein TonB
MYETSEKPRTDHPLKGAAFKRLIDEKKAAQETSSGSPTRVDFAKGLLENSDLKQPKRIADFLISLVGQTVFVLLLILLPLLFTQTSTLQAFERTMLVLPPPPPPPPPATPARVLVRPKVSLLESGKLYAPRVIPKRIEIVKETQAAPVPAGVAGGVPGGVPGGTLGGVLGGILSSANPPVPPPPPPPSPVKSKRPFRVGGNVQAPQLIRDIQPIYPPLARQTRTQGVVILDCVIDAQGNVTQMKLVSGHPLLVPAAFDAVRQWKYRPTLLNRVPVAVEMEVTVKFTMGS